MNNNDINRPNTSAKSSDPNERPLVPTDDLTLEDAEVTTEEVAETVEKTSTPLLARSRPSENALATLRVGEGNRLNGQNGANGHSSNGAQPTGAKREDGRTGNGSKLITIETLRDNPEVHAMIRAADDQLGVMGFTEHGFRHVGLVANIAQNILLRLGRPERMAQLAAVAGYLHDIGNLVNRTDHAATGALLAKDLLRDMGMRWDELALVLGAIGNHEERVGEPAGDISAAIIIADKSDVHRTRVRNPNPLTFDIHDRVNYASQRSFVRVDAAEKTLTLELTIDTEHASLADYFNIFLTRMMFIKKSCDQLGVQFRLEINQTRMI